MTTNINNEQENIFDMFNLLDEHAEKKKAEDAEKKKLIEAERKAKGDEIRKKVEDSAIAAQSKAPAIKVEEAFTPNEETIIRYYGETFEITAYFTPEELAEGLLVKKKDGDSERKPLEPEMLRKRLEKDFPELVKSHTEIIFLKEKNIIVPTMKAKKKGNCENVSSSDSTSLFPTKIPFEILRKFISLAKLYGEENLEVHGDIYYNNQKNEFFLDIPKQAVHRLWAEVIEDSYSIVERVEDAIKVLEIHSHHSMPPFPSNQDNASERVPGMHYAIVGYTDRYFPEVYVRKFISDYEGHITKETSYLFELPFEQLPLFDTESIEVYSK